MVTVSTAMGLALIAILPILLGVVIFFLEKYTKLSQASYRTKQILYGVAFGLLAVSGTEFGVNLGDVTANARDAAPLCAGLLFGGPAGIIAGLIGAVERWFATLWGVGEYTRVACTVSTMLAGVFAAGLRKYIFRDKRPSAIYAWILAATMETMHMLMIFVVKYDDATKAFGIVQKCAIPMILVNSIAVGVGCFVIRLLYRDRIDFKLNWRKISKIFQRRLLVCILLAFFVSLAFTHRIESGATKTSAVDMLTTNISDVKVAISDMADGDISTLVSKVAVKAEDEKNIYRLKTRYGVSEINVFDVNGNCIKSTNSEQVGVKLFEKKGFESYRELVTGKRDILVDSYKKGFSGSNFFKKYAAAKLGNGFIMIGIDAGAYQTILSGQINKCTENRHIGKNGFILVTDADWKVINSVSIYDIIKIKNGTIVSANNIAKNTIFEKTIMGTQYYCALDEYEGCRLIACYSKKEAKYNENMTFYLTVFIEIIVFVALFILIFFLVDGVVVNNVDRVNERLRKITKGDLNVVVDVNDNDEFSELSADINATVGSLKSYIEKEATRLDKELDFAKSIQHSVLPTVFPKGMGFEIFTYMNTAKEVGGDFYDFYPIGNDKFAFVVADVSGKGIPAAMFMMTSKSMLKNYVEANSDDLARAVSAANDELCANNRAGMFVTVWMGVADLNTGEVTFVNAGHNAPLIRSNGKYTYHDVRSGIVMAAMDGIPYKKHTFKLEPGDVVFLYTDGVTEATDANDMLYGEDRLISFLNKEAKEEDMTILCHKVKDDVDDFVGEAPQFDDITMVAFKYTGR